MIKQQTLKDAITYIDSWLSYKYTHLEMPGFVVAIRHKDTLLYNKAFGYANIESKTKMTTNHIFRIASHSKMFTATAIMQLQENGKLKLDDSAVSYVPWLKEHSDSRWQNVTIRQLLSHSAGVIRDGLDCDYWAVSRPFPDYDEFKQELLRAELVKDSNTTLKYSNYGFTLLGMIVESVSGEPYNDYVINHIVNKLDLQNTGPEYSELKDSQYVTGYSRRDINKQRLPIDIVDTRAMSAATGFYATAEDLCTFGAEQFMTSKKLLSIESKKEMQRVQWSGFFAGEREEYGLGIEVEHIDERQVVGHGGGFPGQITQTLVDPHEEFVVSVLTNCIDGNAVLLNKGIIAIINWFIKASEKEPSHPISQFNGRFMVLWGTSDIVAYGDSIVSVAPDQWLPFKYPVVLEYIDEKTLKIAKSSSFLSPGELVHYTFQNGKPTKIIASGTTMLPVNEYQKQLQGKKIISLK